MSKAKEAIEPDSARKVAGTSAEPNGVVVPILKSGDNLGLAIEVDTDLSMELDEERQSAGEPEILWRRQPDDSRSIHPSMPYQRRTLGYMDSSSVRSTRSLYDTDLDYRIENNRRYVSDYAQPNDEAEQSRMQIMHQALFLLISQLTSISLSNPTKILDVGTGTGDWVIGMGEAFPSAEVIGTDMAAIQPTAVPPNVFFEIFDVEDEDEWTYPQDHFDLVHFRNMAGSFNSWDKMYQRSLRHLKPGGWIEVIDFDDHLKMFAEFFSQSSEMYDWYLALKEASVRSGKDIGATHLHAERLSACGFVDVEVTSHVLPIGVWPEEPEMRRSAKLWLLAALTGFESVSLRLLTRDMGWEAEKVLRLCRNMEESMRNLAMDKEKAKGLGATIKILVGRKPDHSKDTTRGKDGAEVMLEVDDTQPEGKRVKMDTDVNRLEGGSDTIHDHQQS